MNSRTPQDVCRQMIKIMLEIAGISFFIGATTGWLFHTLWVLIKG